MKPDNKMTAALESIVMSGRQRARVEEAVRASEFFLGMLFGVAQRLRGQSSK